MKDIMKIVKSIEDFGLLIKGISETIQSEAKEHKEKLLCKLLHTLGAWLWGNKLASKGVHRVEDRVIS